MNLFLSTFKDNSNVKVEGKIIDIMGGGSLAPIEAMFDMAFFNNHIASIPANFFEGIKGEPAKDMFAKTFGINDLTSIPKGLFSGIKGKPVAGMFRSTFADNHKLSEINDLGMDITAGTTEFWTYAFMFDNDGSGKSGGKVTVNVKNLVDLFTEPGSKIKSLSQLYSGKENNHALSFYSSWYDKTPNNWK
jgi:hypothetical protein